MSDYFALENQALAIFLQLGDSIHELNCVCSKVRKLGYLFLKQSYNNDCLAFDLPNAFVRQLDQHSDRHSLF